MKKLNFRVIVVNLFIDLVIKFFLLNLNVSSIDCNDLYKSLCTPSVFQIKELIKHAFTIRNENLTEFNRWTHGVNLREFCKSNGFKNEKLPDLIKVSKLPKITDEKKDQVDILMTIKVPIGKFFVDQDDKTNYKYWLLHKWPFEPFYCRSCRSFLTYSTKKNKNVNNKMTFIYGIMQNKYSYMVDPENFETIRREVKTKFFKQEFNFLANKKKEKVRSFNNSIDRLNNDSTDHLNNQTKIHDHLTKNNLNSLNQKVNNNEIVSNLSTNISTTWISTTWISTVSTTSTTPNNATTNQDNNQTTTTSNPNDPDYNLNLIKKSIYVNLSTFAGSEKYFLVGMNMLNLDGIFLKTNPNNSVNSSTYRMKRDLNQLLSIKSDEFYLEYSLCYNSIANLYLPNDKCFPLFIEDQLKHVDNNRSIEIADCVCWNPHFYKSLVFYQVLLILVFIGLLLIFCNKLNRKRIIKQNLATSRYNYTQTPGQILNKETKLVVYQIILQIHNPNNGKIKLPGRLNVKLFTNLNQPFYEISFTNENRFFKPFLFNDDILKTTSYIYSDTTINDIKKLVVEFEAIDDRNRFFYLYGIVITNGLLSTFTFPYSNYLAHRTEVHLSERNVWMNYISRHENLIPLSDILPICNPKSIKLSKIEKLLFIIIFSSKFASNALQLKEYEDVHWSIIFCLDFITNILVYMLFFTLHILYAKPLLNREYFFIKLNLEFIEIKFLIFISSIFIFNSPISSIYEININLWKDKLTIDSLRVFDKILFQNDLIWALNFFTSVSLFLIFTHFFEIYFYRLRNKQNISSGPSNSLADRLMTSQ